jgi:hypothetical protein
MTEKEVKVFRAEILKRKGDHIYIKVFDGILEMEIYDEETLKANFDGTKTLNNFSIAKNNLYEKILDVLCTLPHYQNVESKFDYFRQQVTILLRKSLYKQAIARVNKSLRLAEKLEAYRKIFDLHDIMREIGRNYLQPQEYLGMMSTLRSKETWLKEVEQNLRRYRDLFDSASIAHRVPQGMRMTLVASILGHELMQDESECRSISAKLYFFRAWNHLYEVQGRDTGWKFFTTRIIELLEENEQLLADPGKFLVYINAISDLGANAIVAREFRIAMEAAEKLNAVRKSLKTGDAEALLFSRYWRLQLQYAKHRGDVRNGIKAIEQIKEGLRKHKSKLSKADAMDLRFLISEFLITIDHNSEAIPWILSLRDEKLESSRPELHFSSWILFLLAHFSLGHLDVVEQQIPGTQNYLRDRKALPPSGKAVISFLKKSVNAKSNKDQMELLRKLSEDLARLSTEAKEDWMAQLFGFQTWVKAKLEGKLMSEVLRISSEQPPTITAGQ